MDHVFPLEKGGPNCAENLLPACRWCNAKKGSKWLRADILEMALEEAHHRADAVKLCAEWMQFSNRAAETRVEEGSLPLTSQQVDITDGGKIRTAARSLQAISEEIVYRYFGEGGKEKSG